jgi:hypothetical protein
MFACVLAVAMWGGEREAVALPMNCFGSYGRCNYEAAREPSFWRRTIMGLDCEINLWGCLRENLIG